MDRIGKNATQFANTVQAIVVANGDEMRQDPLFSIASKIRVKKQQYY